MIVTRQLDRAERWLFERKHAAYGVAVMRMALGLAILGSLVANFADRHYIWGAGSRWLVPWLSVDEWGFPFTVIFGGSDPAGVFTLKYLALVAVTVMFILGWRTRVITPVLLVMLASLMRLNPMATDAGDNLTRISLLFLCFADASQHWSLDARRRRGAVSRRLNWPAWPGTLFHNVALMAIAGQVFVVYVVSGLSKVQGSMWREGVGLYYPLRIGQYEAWPALNEIVYSSGFIVTIGSYVTVFVQVFFPLLLMRRIPRVVALIVVFGLHVGIAVTMALPWFSLAILAADAIFIRDQSYRWLADRVIDLYRRRLTQAAAAPPAAESERSPVPVRAADGPAD